MPSLSSPSLDPALLDRWLAGLCSAAEVQQVEYALARDTRLRVVVAELRAMPHGNPTPNLALPPAREAWELLAQRAGIANPVQKERIERRRSSTPKAPMRTWGIRVSLVACVVMAFTVGVVLGPSWQRESTTAAEYRTTNGQRATVVLPDGTTAILNVASRLRIPDGFGKTTRRVEVTGEAFFVVAHTSRVPFVVRVSDVEATVLGTEFTARRYETDTAAQVAVQNGKVQVALPSHQGIVLTAGKSVALQLNGRAVLSAAPARAFGFVRGVLALDNVRLADAIQDLNRWYDADIRFEDAALGEMTLLGALPGGSRADLARMMEMILPVRTVIEGRTVTLFHRS